MIQQVHGANRDRDRHRHKAREATLRLVYMANNPANCGTAPHLSPLTNDFIIVIVIVVVTLAISPMFFPPPTHLALFIEVEIFLDMLQYHVSDTKRQITN